MPDGSDTVFVVCEQITERSCRDCDGSDVQVCAEEDHVEVAEERTRVLEVVIDQAQVEARCGFYGDRRVFYAEAPCWV